MPTVNKNTHLNLSICLNILFVLLSQSVLLMRPLGEDTGGEAMPHLSASVFLRPSWSALALLKRELSTVRASVHPHVPGLRTGKRYEFLRHVQ